MSTVLKADGVITNPKLGKIDTIQLITTESCIRDTVTDLMGLTTDTYNGGTPYPWVGSANLFALSQLGLTQQINANSGTTYLNMPYLLDLSVSYEAGVQGNEHILDLRRPLTGDNYCYRLNMNASRFAIQRRGVTGSLPNGTMINLPALVPGDKVYASIVGSVLTVRVNNVIAFQYDDAANPEMLRPGTIAFSRASVANGTNTYIKNLNVFSVG